MKIFLAYYTNNFSMRLSLNKTIKVASIKDVINQGGGGCQKIILLKKAYLEN